MIDNVNMHKYDGRVIYQSQDDDGIIEVVEALGIRTLHFGSEPRQSSLLVSSPDELHAPYARAMMAWLLFKKHPGHVLMIGLGGGTLTKFLLRHFDECKVKVVEYRRSVVKIARSYFGLPIDPRLKIIIGDGGHYVRQRSLMHSEQYDLLMIDAFNDEGMADSVSGETFFDGCKILLKKDGMLAINLWGTDKDLFQQVAKQLGCVFEWRLLFLPVRGRGNIIGFAFNNDVPMFAMNALKARSQQLAELYNIEFPAFVQDIKRNNHSVINRVIKP